MSSSKFTYRAKWIVAAIIIWEVIFWAVYFITLKTFGSANHKSGIDQLMYKYPEALNLMFTIAPIIGFYLYNVYRHNKLAMQASNRVVKSFLKPVSTFSSFAKYFLFRNAFALLIIAMAQPIYGKKKVAGTSESLELVVCLDISNSMNTRDISLELSRLEVAKRSLIQLVNNLHGEKVGFCLFANSAFVHLPLTRDYPAAKLFVQDIETNMIASQGTNIAEALEISVDMFSKEKTTKGIILVTDGENHEVNPDEILASIKKSQVQLSVLGIGTKKGGLIPKNPKRPELGYRTNAVGKTIVKSPELAALSAPKSKTATEGSPVAVSLKIKAPLTADIVTLLNVSSAKSTNAVVPLVVGVTGFKACPFAV